MAEPPLDPPVSGRYTRAEEVRARFKWRDPAYLLATWFGSGLIPKMPGTAGTFAALPVGALVMWAGGAPALVFAALFLFPVGCWAAERYVVDSNRPSDPGEVVIDEVVAVWLALAVVPFGVFWWLGAAALFRVFDIAKVPPARYLDRRVKGGFGTMVDDLAAAAWVAALALLGRALLA